MNSRQKVVQERFLQDEQAVLKRLDKVYGQSLKDINQVIAQHYDSIKSLTEQLNELEPNDPMRAILQSRIRSKVYQKNYQEQLKNQVSGILNNLRTKQYTSISQYLDDCYTDGFIGAVYDLHGQDCPVITPINQQAVARAVQLESKISKGLYTKLGENVELLKRKITAQVSRALVTGQSFAQCAKAIADYTTIGYNRSVRIARTEGHRVQVSATMDAISDAKQRGADVVKQWDATLDGRTRESHRMVDGEIREIDQKFSNGLMYPGDPAGGAGEVVNCRCALLQRAKWALDDKELQTLKDRAQHFGLDKTASFDDFKKKYLKAVDTQNTQLARRLRNIEIDRKSLRYEMGTILDQNGSEIVTLGGSAHQVAVPQDLIPYLEDAVFTHNHPNGGCFSRSDIEAFISTKLYEVRVSTPQGTFFSLKKGDGDLYAEDFLYTFKARKIGDRKVAQTKIQSMLDSGELSLDEWNRKGFDLVVRLQEQEIDEWLTKNAKKFGYIYTKGDL